MSRFRMVFAESIRSLTANLSTTVAATMTVLIGMFLLGLFIALGTWVLSWSDHAADKLRTKVFLCTDTTCPTAGEVTPAQISNVAHPTARDARRRASPLRLEGGGAPRDAAAHA